MDERLASPLANHVAPDVTHCGEPMLRLWSRNGWLKRAAMDTHEYRCTVCHAVARVAVEGVKAAPDLATQEVRSKLRAAGAIEIIPQMILVNPDRGCWEWQGSLSTGYGRFADPRRKAGGNKVTTVHRYTYALLKGAIPQGLFIDHLCRNKKCCNPEHLEAVTPRINSLRSESPPALNHQRTVCPEGHPYDLLNTKFNYKGHRQCVICQDAWAQQRWVCPACDKDLRIKSKYSHWNNYCPTRKASGEIVGR